MEEVVKKKRGRKPKVHIEPVITETVEKEEKKRGRKPKYVYNSFELGTTTNTVSEDENIIVRLNVSNINHIVTEDEQDHPYAYNSDNYCNISSLVDNHILNDISSNVIIENEELKVVNILKDFEEKNKNKEWPSNTSICCYWCCHRFDNAPYGIPINFQNNNYNVYGCFCSLECASAYNFKNNECVDQMWERYNLMNMLYRKLNIGKIIKPAPDRIALKIFGGYLDIDKFREYFKSNKILNVNFPPMSSLTQQIEEINDYELNNDYKYIPLDNDRINKFKERQMLFKRNKPLINSSNTLESTMNLSIKYN
jgi:hypothetical protein